MDLETFEFIKNSCDMHSSWAVWAPELDTPKSNMGNLSIFDVSNNPHLLNQLNPNIILVGLNPSHEVPKTDQKLFGNFHNGGPHSQDYKIRYGLKDTFLEGAYMTDIIKDFPELVSGNVLKYLKKNPKILEHNIKLFEEEIKFLGSEDPIIIAFGSICYKFLLENLSSDFNIFKITHYAHFINSDKYRKEIKEFIDSLMKTDLKKHLI